MSLLNDELIINKDGSLLACFRLYGLDLHTHTEQEEAEARQQWIQSMQQLAHRPLRYFWITHRLPYTLPANTSRSGFVSKTLDQEWRDQQHTQSFLESQHYLVLEYHAERTLHRITDRLRFFMQSQEGHFFKALFAAARTALDPTAVFRYTPEELAHIATSYEDDMRTLIGLNPQLHFERLHNRDGQLGQFLSTCLSCRHRQRQVLPQEAFFLDEFLSQKQISVAHDHLQMLDHQNQASYLGAMTLRFAHPGELPAHSPLLMHFLDHYPRPLQLVHAINPLSKRESERYLKQMYRYFHHREYHLRAYLAAVFNGGQFHEAMRHTAYHQQAAECEDILHDVMQNMTGLGWHNTTALLTASSPAQLKQDMTNLSHDLQDHGVRSYWETEHLLSSYCLFLQQHRFCARWDMLSHHNITDYLPFTYYDMGKPEAVHLSEQMGEPQPPLLTTRQADHAPWHWDPHYADNGHAFIIGPTGAGKSILGNVIAMQYLQYKNSFVIIFDKDRSARIPILLEGGRYITEDTLGTLNPCAQLNNHEEWVIAWLATLLPDSYRFRQDDYQDFQQAIESTKALPLHLWRLGSIVCQLASQPLREALLPWTEGHVWGHFFDHPCDTTKDLWSHSLLGFDAHHIMMHPQAALPFITYIVFHIEQYLDCHHSVGPTLLYFSEAWQLMRTHRFQLLLVDWLKRFRKKSASLIFDTQSFEDMEASALFPAIRDNVSTRIYLPNPHMSAHLQQKLMDCYELTAHACDMIRQGHTKRDYFIHRAPRFHRIQLSLSSRSLACLRSDQYAQHCFDRHYESGTTDWKRNYLQEMDQHARLDTHP